MERKAKIVATIGPSCNTKEMLKSLIQSGMDVARLNFSHGSHEEHKNNITLIRELAAETNKPIPIIQDLQGPKLRVGRLSDDGIKLVSEQNILLTTKTILDDSPDKIVIPLDVPDLVDSLSKGAHILLDDGNLEFEVLDAGNGFIEAKVILGGILKSHKGVNFPGVSLNIPSFTEKDREDLMFGLQQQVDYVAMSFVRTAQDICIVREVIQACSPNLVDIPIIAKLERPEAIGNLEEILDTADGVMVARGDLGVETSPADVPVMQKKIIRAANRHAKLVITATQMLDSMIHNPRPTRAEASDVANAIFDGTGAVMLSGETASGKYPIESVVMMDKIIREAESHFCDWGYCDQEQVAPTMDDATSITRAARELAKDRDVAGIAVFTQSGRTAVLMSKARPEVTILAFTPELRTYHRLGLLWGIKPFLVPYASNVEQMLRHVDNVIVNDTNLNMGDQIILISGFPVGAMRPPNFALLHTIGQPV